MKSVVLLSGISLLFAAAASGAPLSAEIASTLYGHLDQNTTGYCTLPSGASFGCGPTATVNSFLMLDSVYRTTLIGDRDDDLDVDNDDLTIVGGILSGAGYMGCAACAGGTSVDKLIEGKRKFIKDEGYEDFYEVRDMALPDFEWLYEHLAAVGDIEILVGFYDAEGTRLGGHYLTLNKIFWDDMFAPFGSLAPSEAYMNYIDPNGGTDGTHHIYSYSGGGLASHYGTGPGSPVVASLIEWGIYEGPYLLGSGGPDVPEPSTVALMMGAGGLLFAIRRRRESN